jgi:hypothetical protein
MKTPTEFLQQIDGAWDKLAPKDQEPILEILAQFHFRDGKKYDDGSMGTVYISPKQFRDLLAWLAQ